MAWLIDAFYLHPLRVVFLVLGVYASAAIWLLPRGARQAQQTALAVGLKPINLNNFLRYLNYPEKGPDILDLDGSKFGMPIIDSIVTGRYDNFIVSLFMFTLPTGRTGTQQTITHVRSATEVLPKISIIDPTFVPNLSELLKDASGHNKFRLRDSILENTTFGDKNITDKLKSVKGLVLYASGYDLLFYIQAKNAEPDEYRNLVTRGIDTFKMIKSGNIDMSLLRESEAQKAYNLYLCSKGLLVMSPALVTILLVGYGYKFFAFSLIVTFLLFYGIAKLRYNRYRGLYPR